MSNLQFGNLGEKIAQKLLVKNGYQIITSNFKSKFGEIDIVATHKDTLVFVEVKTKTTKRQGKPEEVLTSSRLGKIKKTGEYFSQLNPDMPKKLRVEVVAIDMEHGRIVTQKIIKVD